jgi:lactate dehydrogenase-like 2-hydroxyacid dehydrogenase
LQFLEYGSKDIIFLAEYINKNIDNWENIINSDVFAEYEKNTISRFLLNNNYLMELYDKSNIILGKLFKENNVAIWGLGLCGKNILSYLKKFNVKPLYAFDENSNLYNSYIDDVLITSFENASDKCDIVIVTLKDKVIFDEIKKKIEKTNKYIKTIYYAELFEIK